MTDPGHTIGALAKAWLWLLGLVLVAAGLFFLVGGARLAWQGGSWYFLIAGAAILASGVLVALREPSGGRLFILTFLATIPWALWEVGLTYWPLVSRLFAMGIGALVVVLTLPILRRAAGQRPLWGPTLVAAAVFAVGIVATGVTAFSPRGVIAPTEILAAPTASDPAAPVPDWAAWGANNAGTRFSALGDITPENVTGLEVAWTAHTGETPESTGSGAEDQNTPIQIGDALYICTAYGTVISLDADTGAEKWRHVSGGTTPAWQRCRGVAYYDAATAERVTPEPADATADAVASPRRIFVPTVDARLIGLDADTGQPAAGFGVDGVVDLKVGMGEVKPGYYQQTSTPLVAGNLVIVGGRVADNNEIGEPPGVVRAFDVLTGELVWAWDPGNPEVTREPLSPEGYTRGTPNVWAAMSYDPALGLVYLPTGNATPDFWAGSRTALDDEFSSSIVALNVATGRVVWHFQAVHHDLWDFDVPSQPVLYDIPNADGTTTPAVISVQKSGMIYVLDRATGEPITEVQNLPVPQGDVPGERYSPTQPFSVGMPMIGNQTLTETDMWGATPFDQLLCRISFTAMRHQGVFTPPGLDRSLQFPGSLGGMNWGSVSIDPTTNLMFVNDMRLGLANYLIPRDQVQGGNGIEMGVVPQLGTPFGAMRERYLSPLGIPCQAPPFGTLSAIDLVSHELVWQVPVGTVEDTGPLGLRMGLPIPIGMPTLGPTLATHSGLVFIAGTQDFYLRAYDSRTGAEVWKARLPVGSQGGPMTYRSPKTGKQYVVVTAGGARQSPDRGDYVVAYALP
ncbi:MAG: membrane-bound PQQ-dependent dehydrogenase, glucose/quinate/shikimate family [Rhodovulum sulfidophilum]|uniref:Membrane-bound PQQ-dependent dehydrogenase, glucose/quinate/shikimate family n=1 Tax=Rhodovulum sulfidophilum TaxID=35806 RepID=A0A2W5NDB2_RHOSU|nr:MAG: membrane-bound PQQ-dependent dehydrogenase, glucose/quinate/shikimate family [Rhodovulum sulfidophilum]